MVIHSPKQEGQHKVSQEEYDGHSSSIQHVRRGPSKAMFVITASYSVFRFSAFNAQMNVKFNNKEVQHFMQL